MQRVIRLKLTIYHGTEDKTGNVHIM